MSSERVEGMDRWRRGVLGTFACATLGRSSTLDKFTTSLPDWKMFDMIDPIPFNESIIILAPVQTSSPLGLGALV
jgi:hypothetical protein